LLRSFYHLAVFSVELFNIFYVCSDAVERFLFFWVFWVSDFVPGRPGTEEFVPGFLLLPLSWDKGTAGQGNIFVPGRPAGCPVPWKPYSEPLAKQLVFEAS
jgi:hypothetical protein